MPDIRGADILINQQLSQYRSALMGWTSMVRSARTPVDAFRLAGHPPAPGHLIRAISALWNSDKARAKTEVERRLLELAKAASPEDRDFTLLMRLCQGHYPQVWRLLDDARRKASRPTT